MLRMLRMFCRLRHRKGLLVVSKALLGLSERDLSLKDVHQWVILIAIMRNRITSFSIKVSARETKGRKLILPGHARHRKPKSMKLDGKQMK